MSKTSICLGGKKILTNPMKNLVTTKKLSATNAGVIIAPFLKHRICQITNKKRVYKKMNIVGRGNRADINY